jgi:hypothetical protein
MKTRIYILLSLMIIIPLGLCTKWYHGPVQAWVNDSLGGVFYEIFWCLVGLWFFAKSKPWRIALIVLLATCMLEVLQLWHPLFLQILRSNFSGKMILGTTFVWSDFLYYILGSGLGWLWLVFLLKLSRNHSTVLKT